MKGLISTLVGIFAALILLFIFSNLKSCNYPTGSRENRSLPNDSLVVEEPNDVVAEEPVVAESAVEVEIPDSIEGNQGKLRVAMLWDFRGDADLHVVQPSGKCIDYKRTKDRSSGGEKDVDNRDGGSGSVENIYWNNPPNGTYTVYLNYYCKSIASGNGPVSIVVETTDDSGRSKKKSFSSSLQNRGQWKGICSFTYNNGNIQFANPTNSKPSKNSCVVSNSVQ